MSIKIKDYLNKFRIDHSSVKGIRLTAAKMYITLASGLTIEV